MSEPTAIGDAVDRAGGACRQPANLDTFMAGAAPLREDEVFAIDDLTDDEWTAFTRALHE